MGKPNHEQRARNDSSGSIATRVGVLCSSEHSRRTCSRDHHAGRPIRGEQAQGCSPSHGAIGKWRLAIASGRLLVVCSTSESENLVLFLPTTHNSPVFLSYFLFKRFHTAGMQGSLNLKT